MKAIKIIGIAFFSVIIIAVIAIILLPNDYKAETKIVVNKPIYMVFNKIADFSTWKDWSIWYKYDVDAKYDYEGTMGEIGSKMLWEGDTVGVGYQELIKKEKFNTIIAKLVFTSPFENQSDIEFYLKEVGNNTEITWINKGVYGFGIQRIMGYLMMGQLEAQFNEGLSNFKKWIEALPTEPNLTLTEVEVQAHNYFYIEEIAENNPAIISEKMGKAYSELMDFINNNGIKEKGSPFAINIEFAENSWKFQAAIPVENNDTKTTGRIKSGLTYSGKAIRAVYFGPYNGATVAYQKIDEYVTKHKYQFSGYSWEVYVSDPANTPADKIETHIYFPIK